MSQNKEPVFPPRVVTAFLIALGIGLGLYIGRKSTLMNDWLFMLFGLRAALFPIIVALIYEAWLVIRKDSRT
jgi:hypothetical protein